MVPCLEDSVILYETDLAYSEMQNILQSFDMYRNLVMYDIAISPPSD